MIFGGKMATTSTKTRFFHCVVLFSTIYFRQCLQPEPWMFHGSPVPLIDMAEVEHSCTPFKNSQVEIQAKVVEVFTEYINRVDNKIEFIREDAQDNKLPFLDSAVHTDRDKRPNLWSLEEVHTKSGSTLWISPPTET